MQPRRVSALPAGVAIAGCSSWLPVPRATAAVGRPRRPRPRTDGCDGRRDGGGHAEAGRDRPRPADARRSRAPRRGRACRPRPRRRCCAARRRYRRWTTSCSPTASSRSASVRTTCTNGSQHHPPSGFRKGTTGFGTDRGIRSWGVEDDVSVATGEHQQRRARVRHLGSTGGAGNTAAPAIVRVDSVVGWTAPRPADEFVPAAIGS